MTAAAQKLSRVGIGASQVPSVLGLNPFSKSLIEPWQDILGIAPAREETAPQRWGKRHEPTVRQEYADVTGATVVIPPESIFHPEHTWRRATPDGLILHRRKPKKTVQIKTTDAMNAKEWGPDGSSEVPVWVAAQCAWEWHVLSARYGVEVNEADVAVLIGGNDFRILHLERDLEAEESIVAGCTEFWETYVVPQVAPPLDATQAYREYLGRRYAKTLGSYLAATEDIELTVERMKLVREGALAMQEEHTRLESHLLLALGEHVGAEGAFGKFSAAVQTRKHIDWKAVANSMAERAGGGMPGLMAELATEHTKESAPFRSLRFPRGFPRKPFGKDD